MKLSESHQSKWKGDNLYNKKIRDDISRNVKLHNEIENPRSSAAACLNVLGSLKSDKDELKKYLNTFGLGIGEIISLPKPFELGDEVYDDTGPVYFEWIGPKKSPINERGSLRGQNRTSIDAYLIATIDGKTTQILIEWKFTESYKGISSWHKFGGKRGIERLRRYSSVLKGIRYSLGFPFVMESEGAFGICDFSYEPFYQLFRMTLLAKTTIGMRIAKDITVEDYRIVHLMHSDNEALDVVKKKYLTYSPGLKDKLKETSINFHDLWLSTLSETEKPRHYFGYWNKALTSLNEGSLKNYLYERYY